MQIGSFPVRIGLMADPDVLPLTAQIVDQTSFHSLWAPEHIVLISQSTSKYLIRKTGGSHYLRFRLIFLILSPRSRLPLP